MCYPYGVKGQECDRGISHNSGGCLAVSSSRKLSLALQQACGFCIQGDVLAAYNHLRSQPIQTKREEVFAQRLYRRFLTDSPKYRIKSQDTWIRHVVQAYYRYYTAVLTKQASPNEGEQLLFSELSKFIPGHDLDAIEAHLKDEFAERGYHFLGGITPPFWGPYVWKTQVEENFNVQIPSGTERLKVYFLKDFLMLSWLEFASLGLVKTGGWAKEDGLYCVFESYKSILDKSNFAVSFLKHEAQHVADYRMFPTLQAKDLEYRAKLVELIYFQTKDKLMDFLTQSDTNVENAHSYAAYCIVSKLSQRLFHSEAQLERKRWDVVSVEQINDASMQMYDKHTKELINGSTGI
jgi:hypothetical protein